MASGIGGYATGSRVGNIPRKVADRAETVVGSDWDTVKRVAREEASMYGLRGLSKGRKARKPSSKRSAR